MHVGRRSLGHPFARPTFAPAFVGHRKVADERCGAISRRCGRTNPAHPCLSPEP
jgi:hypothetical protein